MKGLFMLAAAAVVATSAPVSAKEAKALTADSVMASVSQARRDCRAWLRGHGESLKEAKETKRRAQSERRQVGAISSSMSPFTSPSLSSANFTNVPSSEEEMATATVECIELLGRGDELAAK